MNLWRTAGLVGVTVLVLSVAVGTSGFATGTLERGIDIAIESEDDSYIGIQAHSVTAENGRSTVPVLTVRNNFDGDVRLQVSATVDAGPSGEGPPKIHSLTPPQTLGVGEEGTIQATVICSNSTQRSGTFSIEATATGPDVSSSFTRDVTVTCSGNPPAHASATEVTAGQVRSHTSPRL